MTILYTDASRSGEHQLHSIDQMVSLQRKGHRVMLACREDSWIAKEAYCHNISVSYIPFKNSLHIPSILALIRLIIRSRPTLIVTHNSNDTNIVGIARALMIGRISHFCIIQQKTGLPEKMRMLPLNYMCDVVAVPAKAMIERLMQAGCRKPVYLVPPGCDFKRLQVLQEIPLPTYISDWLLKTGKAPVIVQSGMMCSKKINDFIINVLYRLKQSGFRFRWLITGHGAEKDKHRLINVIAALGMEDYILVCGNVIPVARLYKIAQLMVTHTCSESFNMDIVEAALCGVPIMADYVGSIPDMLLNGHNGILLPPNDKDAWLESLTHFLSDPTYMQYMACQAYWDMETRYSIDVTVLRLLEFSQHYKDR
ncbi:glycosyltransferase [Escherichia coli]|uniref:glycosyltransferase n=1 Tax=Escherichia coli TaxID=562 RepID=UPI00292980A3|nr:glycosyltransferase [Escherichia coli]EIQ0712614.1 glycosyltransferase [Escherichia coli]ELO3295494.1 glycosyltransferase [Escherichia coli]ELP2065851.1 glycosyltransferase [Escherichia coli]EMA9206040.1 glycosyltransferase [Escherichia coli]